MIIRYVLTAVVLMAGYFSNAQTTMNPTSATDGGVKIHKDRSARKSKRITPHHPERKVTDKQRTPRSISGERKGVHQQGTSGRKGKARARHARKNS
jgi:hypothetical protein